MTALTDTHALRWWLDGSDALSFDARQFFADGSHQIVVSAVVPWELAIKTKIGKLDVAPVLERWHEMIELQGYEELTIDSDLGILAGLLPLHHRDPFDRLLAAQAQITGWPIISADRIFDMYGVRRIW